MRVLLILSHSQLVQGRSWDHFFFFRELPCIQIGTERLGGIAGYTGYTFHVVQRGTGKFSNCCLYIDVCVYIYIYTYGWIFDRETCFFVDLQILIAG